MSHSEPSTSVLSPRIFSPSIADDPENIIKLINDHEVSNYKLGVLLIICSITTWIIGLELVNVVLKSDGYTKPFFFAIIVGSCFSLNFLPDIYYWLTKSHNQLEIDERGLDKQGLDKFLDQNDFQQPSQLTKREVLVLAFQISLVYFSYNLCILESLQFTSASNQTVIGTTSSIFTVFIGAYLKFDRFSLKKLFCVFASLLGVFLINYSESKKEAGLDDNIFQPRNPFLGNCFALVGAFMYATYLILMKMKCGMGDKTTNERQLFGYVGVITILLGIPTLFIVDLFDIEKFEFPPPDKSTLIAICINGVFSVISDYTSVLAMLLTSPLVVSLSLTTAIPITIFIDYIVLFLNTHEPQPVSYVYFLGIVSMLTSVILININITTENELIEDVIEDALEEVANNDEILSPSLPSMIGAAQSSTSPYIRAHLQSQLPFEVGIKHPFSPFLTPKLSHKHSLLRDVSGFNLNENSQLHNDNHSRLYTISGINRDNDVNANADSSKSSIVVYSGGNHKYRVQVVDLDEPLENLNEADEE